MYKTSFALASVLALADALHLKTSCNPCCDGDHDEEVNEETQLVIDEFVEELIPEDDEADDEPEELVPEDDEADDELVDSPCATLVTEIWEHCLGNKDAVTLDDVSQAIDTGFAEGGLSTQEAVHWFNQLSAAD